jgi:hypothetical protein
MEPLIIIQKIQTGWSKKSRGGKMATERNAVPEALAIPMEKLKDPIDGLIEHSISYYEWQGFSSPQHSSLTQEAAEKVRFDCLVIEPLGAELKVIFEYDGKYAGMPVRYTPPGGKPSTRMHLQPGQWGRVLYNGRFAVEEGWWYDKKVFNIGLFEKLEEDLFTSSQPAQVLSQMAKLW